MTATLRIDASQRDAFHGLMLRRLLVLAMEPRELARAEGVSLERLCVGFVFKPLAEEAGAPWAGFHTFRHTFASLHLSQGTNLLQLSRALGHHSPAFTLTRYTHLLPGDEAPALNIFSAYSDWNSTFVTFGQPEGDRPTTSRLR